MKRGRIDRSNSSEKYLLIVIMCLMLSARSEKGGKKRKRSVTRKHKCSISENYISPCNLCSANMKYDGGHFFTDVIAPDSSAEKPTKQEIIILDCLVKAIKTR